MALQIVWMVVTYHRPGEPLTARRRDVIRPTRGGSAEWGVVLFPETRDQVRKTGHRNEAITLKNEIFPWLPRLLEQVALGDPESRLFDHSYSEILQQFRITTYRMGLPKLVMYQARHSGASSDMASKRRTLAEIKKRGGWKSDRSVVRYEKGARLSSTWMRHPAWVRAHAERCEEKFLEIVLHGQALPRPVIPCQ